MSEQEVIPANLSEIKPFSQFESQLATMKADNEKAVFDLSTPKGIKEAKSHIFSIRKVRAALEKARKDADAKRMDIIPLEAALIRAALELRLDQIGVIDVAVQPLGPETNTAE